MQFYDDIREDPILGESVIRSVEAMDADVEGDVAMSDTLDNHRRSTRTRALFIVLLLVAMVGAMGVAVTVGPYDIGFFEAYEHIWNVLTGNGTGTLEEYIVIQYRMPRVVVGIFAGAGLAVCGAVMQSVLKNPLADPYTTGVSSGASLGATIAITAGFSATASPPIVLLAFVFSLLPIGMMIAISKMRNASPTTMIMAGIGIMYIFNAITTVLMLWADPQDLSRVYRWQVGTLDSVTWADAPYIGVVTVVGIIILMILAGRLNVLATGDESAKALGVDADNLRVVCLVLVGIVTAVVVSFTGLIGFVGLVTPHIVRLFIGSDNRYLIPASALFGASLLIIADLIGRSVLTTNIQVGVVMAFIGGPVFLWLLIRGRRSMWG